MLTTDWPPPYKIRKHRLARHVKLRTSSRHGLEITVPYRFNLNKLPDILEEHKIWVLQQLQQWHNRQSAALPQYIQLQSVNEKWSVQYVETLGKLRLMQRQTQEIILLGKNHDPEQCKIKLVRWVKQRAALLLNEELRRMSETIQLPFQDVRFRDQLTRWGSCSTDKRINLNYKLIFLPQALMQHVLIHELCHTKYLNHSESFWRLVQRFDAHCHEHRRALKLADRFVPEWI